MKGIFEWLLVDFETRTVTPDTNCLASRSFYLFVYV